MEGGEGTEDEEFGLGAAERSKSEGHEPMDTMEAGAEAVSMEWKVKDQDLDGGEGVESEDKAPPIQLPPGLISSIIECLEELKKCLEKAAHTIVRKKNLLLVCQNCQKNFLVIVLNCTDSLLVKSVLIYDIGLIFG